MKSLASLAVCAVLLSALPAHAVPGARVKPAVAQFADASYLLRDPGGGYSLYVVWAGEGVTDKGPKAWAAVGRSACRMRRERHGLGITCIVRLRPSRISADAFTMDPALDSATLDAKLNGVRHTASWRGTGERHAFPFYWQSSWGAPPYFVEAHGSVSAFVFRLATANAKLFGRKLRGRPDQFSVLEEYALTDLEVWSDLDTESRSFEIERRFKLPRS